MALFCAAGSLLALKTTSFAPFSLAAASAPSIIWLKNRACWLMVTSAMVGSAARAGREEVDAGGPQGDDDVSGTLRDERLRGRRGLPLAAQARGLAGVDDQDVSHRHQQVRSRDQRGGVDDEPGAPAAGELEAVG